MKKNNEMQYYVRKSWEDVESQAGIDYNFFVNAKKACDKLDGYKVFNSNGEQVYPEVKLETAKKIEFITIKPLEKGDVVMINNNASTFINGTIISETLLKEKLYIRDINETECTIARQLKGPVLGKISKEFLKPFDENETTLLTNSYVVQIIDENCYLYNKPNSSQVLETLNKYSLFTIVNEKDGFGKIKIGPGWINLSQVRKLV